MHNFFYNLTESQIKQKQLLTALYFCLSLTVARIAWLFVSQIPLYGDEAQYWIWSLTPDFGYYSKPPVLAWLIGTSTFLFGDSEAAIRISSPILHLITGFFVYKLSLKLTNNKNSAVWAALTYITLPAVFFSSMLISTDPSFMLLWSISFYFYIAALENDNIKLWIALGIFAGLGLLAKYSMGIFAFSVLAHIILTKNFGIFKNYKMWVGAFTALIIFTPNIYWNYLNDFPSFSHTYDLAQGRSQQHFFLKNGITFIIAQLAITGPVIFAAILFSLRERADLLLKVFTFTFLTIITLIAFYSRAHANWAAPAYIAGVILGVHYLFKHRYYKTLKINFIAQFIIGIMVLSAITVGNKIHPDALGRIYSTYQLVEKFKDSPIAQDHKVFAFDDRMMLSVFKYYMRADNTKSFIKFNRSSNVKDHFDLTTDLNNHIGDDVVVISKWLTESSLNRFGDNIVCIGELQPDVKFGKYSKAANVFLIKGFYGY